MKRREESKGGIEPDRAIPLDMKIEFRFIREPIAQK